MIQMEIVACIEKRVADCAVSAVSENCGTESNRSQMEFGVLLAERVY